MQRHVGNRCKYSLKDQHKTIIDILTYIVYAIEALIIAGDFGHLEVAVTIGHARDSSQLARQEEVC
jgi:hypothetical protein